MPITMDGVILGRGTMEGAERSLQHAMRVHGQKAVRAYERAMSLDLENDPFARKIICDMMQAEDPGQFMMEVFGDERPAGMPFDAELHQFLKRDRQ